MLLQMLSLESRDRLPKSCPLWAMCNCPVSSWTASPCPVRDYPPSLPGSQPSPKGRAGGGVGEELSAFSRFP